METIEIQPISNNAKWFADNNDVMVEKRISGYKAVDITRLRKAKITEDGLQYVPFETKIPEGIVICEIEETITSFRFRPIVSHYYELFNGVRLNNARAVSKCNTDDLNNLDALSLAVVSPLILPVIDTYLPMYFSSNASSIIELECELGECVDEVEMYLGNCDKVKSFDIN